MPIVAGYVVAKSVSEKRMPIVDYLVWAVIVVFIVLIITRASDVATAITQVGPSWIA